MALSFEDKISLVSKVVDKVLNTDNIGTIVENSVKDNGYDNETVGDDLEDFQNDGESLIIDGIKGQFEAKHIEWNERRKHIISEAFCKVFIDQMGNEQQLISSLSPPASNTKSFHELTDNELANVIEYIITHRMRDANLSKHKHNIRNYALQQQWNGSIDFKQHKDTLLAEMNQALQQTVSMHHLQRILDELIHFDMNVFSKLKITKFAVQELRLNPVQMDLDDMKEREPVKQRHGAAPSSSNARNQWENQVILNTVSAAKFMSAIERAIDALNVDLKGTTRKQLDKQKLLTFFEQMGVQQFVRINYLPRFPEKLKEAGVSQGSSKLLFSKIKPLIFESITWSDLTEHEFRYVLRVAITHINRGNKQNKLNAESVIECFRQSGINEQTFSNAYSKKEFVRRIGNKLEPHTTKELFTFLTTRNIGTLLLENPPLSSPTAAVPVSAPTRPKTTVAANNSRTKPQPKSRTRIKAAQIQKPLRFKKYSEIKDKGAALSFYNNQCNVSRGSGFKLHKFIERHIEMHRSEYYDEHNKPRKCQLSQIQENKYTDMDPRQFKYALLYVIIDFNMDKQPDRRISDSVSAKVIDYLCHQRRFKGTDLQRGKCDWATDLYSNANLLHYPAKQIFDAMKRFEVHKLPSTYLDLDLPFIVQQWVDTAPWDSAKPLTVTSSVQARDCPIIRVLRKHVRIEDCTSEDLRCIIAFCVEYFNKVYNEDYNAGQIMQALNALANTSNTPSNSDEPKPITSLQDINSVELFIKVVNECLDELIKTEKIRDANDSLGCQANRDRLIASMRSKNIHGGNFDAEFPKKARFARTMYDPFSQIAKGIKHELLNLYKEIVGFDYRKLSTSQHPEQKADDGMDGEMFVKNFKANKGQEFERCIVKHAKIRNKEHLLTLYGIIAAFYQPIAERNALQFQCLLFLFAAKQFGLAFNVVNAGKQGKLDGKRFITEIKWSTRRFMEYLLPDEGNEEIASAVYDSVMDFHFRLNGINKTEQCKHPSELVYMLKKYVVPKFNERQPSGAKIDLGQLVEFIIKKGTEAERKRAEAAERRKKRGAVDNEDQDEEIEPINGEKYFRKQNRKRVKNDMKRAFGNSLTMKEGPIQKFFCNLHLYSVL